MSDAKAIRAIRREIHGWIADITVQPHSSDIPAVPVMVTERYRLESIEQILREYDLL